MSIKVTAVQKGYYGGLLREPKRANAKFLIEDESEFSKKWMVKGHQDLDDETLARLDREGKRKTQDQILAATRGIRVSDKSPI